MNWNHASTDGKYRKVLFYQQAEVPYSRLRFICFFEPELVSAIDLKEIMHSRQRILLIFTACSFLGN